MLRCLNIEIPSSGLSTQRRKGTKGPVARETGWNARNFQLLGLGTPAGVLLRCVYRTVTVQVHIPPWTRTRLLSLRQEAQELKRSSDSLSILDSLLLCTPAPYSRDPFASFSTFSCTSVPLGSYCVCRRFARSYQLRYLPFPTRSPRLPFAFTFTGPSFYSGSNLLRRHTDFHPSTLIQLSSYYTRALQLRDPMTL